MTDASSAESVLLRSLDRRGVATLTLDRPGKGNAYDQAMLDALDGEAARLAADPAVRVVVLRGSGRHFCVGAEIGAAARAQEGPRVTIPALCVALDALPKPTVALVHGACIGGGVALLSCCDVVLAARTAFFSLPEVRLGFAPGPLIPLFLRAIDARSLRRYLLSGERFGAEEAMRMGLVHELCDADAADAALARLIDELLLAGPNALAQAKRLFLRFAPAPAPPSPELLAELQREFEQGFNAPEAAEGRASFREKRKPRWAMPQQDP
jgi:methylglutaconyl-CoA hydratase